MTTLLEVLAAVQNAKQARKDAVSKQRNVVSETNRLFSKEAENTDIKALLMPDDGDNWIFAFGLGKDVYFKEKVTVKSYNNGKTILIMPTKVVEVYSAQELKAALLDMILQSYQNLKTVLDNGPQH